MSAASSRYTGVAIALHWAIAIAIVSLIGAGWYMTDLPDGAPGQQEIYQIHKSVGITVLLLTVARIIWRVMNPPPPAPADMPTHEKAASNAVHIAFYGLMVAMPLTGWLYSSTAYEFQVPTVLYGLVSWPHLPFMEGLKTPAAHGAIASMHSSLAWVMLALLALHVAGAIKHEITDEEGVLKRMIPGLFGRTDAPRAPGRGAVNAFGGAFAVFALVAGAPLVANAVGGGTDLGGETEIEANWAVDYGASEIRFSGVHDGDAFTGTFGDWSADIAFDPDALETSAAQVRVDTGSAATGTKLYDDSLKAAEWFGVSDFPVATVDISGMTLVDSGYAADATLTVKGVPVEAQLLFTVDIDGDTAMMAGQTLLSRQALNLGLQSDPGGDWVSDEITVDLSVTASRID